MKTTLTIPQANRLARGRARVMVDPEDPRLWRIEGDGWIEAHEPMTRLAWQTFLADPPKAGPPGAGYAARTLVSHSRARPGSTAVSAGPM